MKDKRLTVAMAIGRMNDMIDVLREPVMLKVAEDGTNIKLDDIILGVDTHKPMFYVCSPKQKLRVEDITITNDRLIGKTLFTIRYVVDDKFTVTVVRVTDLEKFTASVGFILDSVTISSKAITLPGGNVLQDRTTLHVRLEAMLNSMLCCMESDDTHTFEYVDMMYLLPKRTHDYWGSKAHMIRCANNSLMRNLWGNVTIMGGRC